MRLAVVHVEKINSIADVHVNVSMLIKFATSTMTAKMDRTNLTVQPRLVPDAEVATIDAKTTNVFHGIELAMVVLIAKIIPMKQDVVDTTYASMVENEMKSPVFQKMLALEERALTLEKELLPIKSFMPYGMRNMVWTYPILLHSYDDLLDLRQNTNQCI